MQKKLSLQQLKVTSFVTEHQMANEHTVKGGLVAVILPIDKVATEGGVNCITRIKTCGVCDTELSPCNAVFN